MKETIDNICPVAINSVYRYYKRLFAPHTDISILSMDHYYTA